MCTHTRTRDSRDGLEGRKLVNRQGKISYIGGLHNKVRKRRVDVPRVATAMHTIPRAWISHEAAFRPPGASIDSIFYAERVDSQNVSTVRHSSRVVSIITALHSRSMFGARDA